MNAIERLNRLRSRGTRLPKWVEMAIEDAARDARCAGYVGFFVGVVAGVLISNGLHQVIRGFCG